MDKYIIQAQKTRHTYMLWVSAFLLIFNVYHTKLMSIFLFSASSGSAFVIQGFAVALMLVYFMSDKKVSLYKMAAYTDPGCDACNDRKHQRKSDIYHQICGSCFNCCVYEV